MNALKTLKLAAATPYRASTPVERAREKVRSYLADQAALFAAQNGGSPFNPTKMVTRKTDQGVNARVEAPRHVRQGWFKDQAGALFLQVRYGSRPLELAPGKTAIAIESLNAIPEVIAKVTEALDGGELDAPLAAAAADRTPKIKAKAA